jgi:hypothetical protein
MPWLLVLGGQVQDSNSWWWAYKCPKHVEQIIGAVKHSVAASWFSSLRLNSWTFFLWTEILLLSSVMNNLVSQLNPARIFTPCLFKVIFNLQYIINSQIYVSTTNIYWSNRLHVSTYWRVIIRSPAEWVEGGVKKLGSHCIFMVVNKYKIWCWIKYGTYISCFKLLKHELVFDT